ncbi:hypothetical protein [Tateyamaria omphalii]|uniref:hypothetical protein n=1 Tax=Tateyamaria omphalii TaxID=299262 RepID=UPI0012FB6C42|nr:hypothetical protein [Tateyamaria omphalii]
MADQNTFPQIPTTVWWGIRNLIKKSPKTKFDASMIGASLGVQPAASRQYVAELKRAQILDEEGAATALALRWRQDDEYANAVKELVSEIYPESLVAIAPVGEAQRDVVTNWFIQQNLGEGSARNKAATYLLISSEQPGEGGSRPASPSKTGSSTKASTQSSPTRKVSSKSTPPSGAPKRNSDANSSLQGFPLNVNVQIHISADASTDQIETIFASMRKHLHDV